MYEIFEQLLQSYGITAYKFCKETGISQSTISTWKTKRNLISGELAKRIAEYFKVSVDYLMTGEEKEGGEKYYLNDETAQVAQEIFENRELRVLFDAARDASPEDLQTTYNMLMALKKKERGYNDDDAGC
ncbi:MAG: helix-turn-helix transcriptional regulator [Blautia sp.]|nr:helix-turn-helix transcriptional regulator [Blautia sp.]